MHSDRARKLLELSINRYCSSNGIPTLNFDTTDSIHDGALMFLYEEIQSGKPVKDVVKDLSKSFSSAILLISDGDEYEKLKCLGYTDDKTKTIFIFKNKGVDILPYIDPSCSDIKLSLIGSYISRYPDTPPNFFQYFNDSQIRVFHEGLLSKVDPKPYADYRFNSKQMQSILYGLNKGVDVTPCINFDMSSRRIKTIANAMLLGLDLTEISSEKHEDITADLILFALKNGIDYQMFMGKAFQGHQVSFLIECMNKKIDVTHINNPKYNLDKMREIRSLVFHGFDVSTIPLDNLCDMQLDILNKAHKAKLDIELLLKHDYSRDQMNELYKGLKSGLDVSAFSNPDLNDLQMEEIRLGEMAKIDHSIYSNPDIKFNTMKAARTCLEIGIDIKKIKEAMPSKDNLDLLIEDFIKQH